MGDLNTLSPLDKPLHQEEHLATVLAQQRTHEHLIKKLCNVTGHINYKPIQNLLDSGLQDSCASSCEGHVKEEGGLRPQALAACMRNMCSASEPTLYNPEVRSSRYTCLLACALKICYNVIRTLFI
jgi:hypothetical protein